MKRLMVVIMMVGTLMLLLTPAFGRGRLGGGRRMFPAVGTATVAEQSAVLGAGVVAVFSAGSIQAFDAAAAFRVNAAVFTTPVANSSVVTQPGPTGGQAASTPPIATVVLTPDPGRLTRP